MIVRETRITECWCSNCHEGQVQQLQQLMFDEQVGMGELIGREIKCQKCGVVNTLEDVVVLMPVEFLVSSEKIKSKAKSNDDMYKWLTS